MKRISIYGHDWETEDDEDGEYVYYSQAAALLQLADERIKVLELKLDKVSRERDDWKQAHDNLRVVYRDIGTALCADMPAELVNEVARRRMRQLQAAREALQGIAKTYPETDEGEVLASMAKDGLEEVNKC